MKIQVTALHRDNFAGVWTTNTQWLSAKATEVVVIDADESPPRPPGNAFNGMKIGRAELALLRKTQGLVIAGTDQANAIEMTAQLAELGTAHKSEIERMGGIIDQLTLKANRVDPLEGRVKEQEQTIADLRARLGRKQPDKQQEQQTKA